MTDLSLFEAFKKVSAFGVKAYNDSDLNIPSSTANVANVIALAFGVVVEEDGDGVITAVSFSEGTQDPVSLKLECASATLPASLASQSDFWSSMFDLLEVLVEHRKIKVLDLSNNYHAIDNRSLPHLARVLMATRPALEHLDLSTSVWGGVRDQKAQKHNRLGVNGKAPRVRAKGANVGAPSSSSSNSNNSNNNLLTLLHDLLGFSVGPDGLSSYNMTLKTLNLSCCGITDGMAKSLVQMLEDASHDASLDGDEEPPAQVPAQLGRLEEINLSFNLLTDKGILEILYMLEGVSFVKTIHVGGNVPEDEDYSDELLRQMEHLESRRNELGGPVEVCVDE